MRADRIEDVATGWLLRRQEADWSHDDQRTLDAWLEEATAHKMAFWRLEAGWESLGRMAALRTPAVPNAANDPAPPRWWLRGLAAAAALVIAPTAAWWGLQRTSATEVYTTPIGGRADVPLADGTEMELNTGTQLRTNLAGTRRQAWLDRGEAYFEVAHDARRPFVVHAGPKNVTVLGTKFLVRREGDRVEVAVIDGRVRVENSTPPSRTTPAAAVLTRGDMIAGDGTSTMLAPRSIAAVIDDLAWRDGLVNFDQVTLADAAGEFNRYTDKPLIVAGDVGATRISGTFEARNAAVFALLLHRTYGLNVVETADEIRIIR